MAPEEVLVKVVLGYTPRNGSAWREGPPASEGMGLAAGWRILSEAVEMLAFAHTARRR